MRRSSQLLCRLPPEEEKPGTSNVLEGWPQCGVVSLGGDSGLPSQGDNTATTTVAFAYCVCCMSIEKLAVLVLTTL